MMLPHHYLALRQAEIAFTVEMTRSFREGWVEWIDKAGLRLLSEGCSAREADNLLAFINLVQFTGAIDPDDFKDLRQFLEIAAEGGALI